MLLTDNLFIVVNNVGLFQWNVGGLVATAFFSAKLVLRSQLLVTALPICYDSQACSKRDGS